MMSVESKQVRDGDEVRRWLEAGQTQLASLLELLHEHDRLRERVEASERENERLRGVTYENEQLRNRLEAVVAGTSAGARRRRFVGRRSGAAVERPRGSNPRTPPGSALPRSASSGPAPSRSP